MGSFKSPCDFVVIFQTKPSPVNHYYVLCTVTCPQTHEAGRALESRRTRRNKPRALRFALQWLKKTSSNQLKTLSMNKLPCEPKSLMHHNASKYLVWKTPPMACSTHSRSVGKILEQVLDA